METCGICEHPLDESALAGVHAGCFAERLPRDAGVAAIGVLVHVLAPALLVWAG
jgi:hypothetical protein